MRKAPDQNRQKDSGPAKAGPSISPHAGSSGKFMYSQKTGLLTKLPDAPARAQDPSKTALLFPGAAGSAPSRGNAAPKGGSGLPATVPDRAKARRRRARRPSARRTAVKRRVWAACLALSGMALAVTVFVAVFAGRSFAGTFLFTADMDLPRSSPPVREGSLVFAVPSPPAQIRAGEVIAFRLEEGGEVVIRQVAQVQNELNGKTGPFFLYFSADSTVLQPPDTQIYIGRVTGSLPSLGALAESVRANPATLASLVTACAILFAASGMSLWKGAVRPRRAAGELK